MVGAAVIVESLIATGIVVLGTAVLYTATKELTKAISEAVQAYGIRYAADKAKQRPEHWPETYCNRQTADGAFKFDACWRSTNTTCSDDPARHGEFSGCPNQY